MIIYIVATNRLTWGKSSDLNEAVFHAIHRAGKPPTQIHAFKIEGEDVTTVMVNDLGRIIGPRGCEVTELGQFDVTKLSPKIYELYGEIADTLHPKDYYELGLNACLEGQDRDDNPYEGENGADWDRGWRAAKEEENGL